MSREQRPRSGAKAAPTPEGATPGQGSLPKLGRDEFVRRLIARGAVPPGGGGSADRFTFGSVEIVVPLQESLDGEWCARQLARLPSAKPLPVHPAVVAVKRQGDWSWDSFVRELVGLGFEAPTGSKPFNEYRRGALRIVVPFGEHLDGAWCEEQLARCALP